MSRASLHISFVTFSTVTNCCLSLAQITTERLQGLDRRVTYGAQAARGGESADIMQVLTPQNGYTPEQTIDALSGFVAASVATRLWERVLDPNVTPLSLK